MKNPELSVVMPVYNGEKYLRQAVDSVLTQSFSDFELIIINDGSNDNSLKIINTYSDPRIRIINSNVNHGVAYSRNLGLRVAKGKYLAWTDCDDLNLPKRFEEQITFLNQNKNFGGCGTSLIRFAGKNNYVFKPHTDHHLVKATLLFRPSIPNATVMLRLDLVRKAEIKYNERLPIAEDYDFILSCSFLFPLTNISKVLYKYRYSETSIMNKFSSADETNFQIHSIVYEKALRYLGIDIDSSSLRLHYLICSNKPFHEVNEYFQCYNWLMWIRNTNDKTLMYNIVALNTVLRNEFYFISSKASKFGVRILFFYLKKSITDFEKVSLIKLAKLFIRCLLPNIHF